MSNEDDEASGFVNPDRREILRVASGAAIKRTAIEPGYLNQTIFVAGRNLMLHVAALFVTAHL
jgi:hypothetical protein